MKTIEPCFSHDECRDFISYFLDGILNKGLLQPLKDYALKNENRMGKAAKSWYDLQVAGYAPHVALTKMPLRFPKALEDIIVLGFQKSVLDMVLMDTIKLYQENQNLYDRENGLRALHKRYLSLNSSVVCADCWQSELLKIVNRAKTEKALQVILDQEGDEFLHQRFVSTKLVSITEPSIAMVYLTLKKTLDDFSSSGKEMKLGEETYKVQSINKFEYVLKNTDQETVITFAD